MRGATPAHTRRKAAFDHMTALAMRMQAQALRIEARAKERLAEEYDAAQERGEVAKLGDNLPSVAASNAKPATAADLGLRRDEIHEARRLRDLLPQPHPRPPPVLWDEVHPRSLEGRADRGDGRGPQVFAPLEARDCVRRHRGKPGQITDPQTERGPGHSALCRVHLVTLLLFRLTGAD